MVAAGATGDANAVKPATGVVLNENNDSVASFSTLKFGIGRFSFTPNESSYKAVVTMPDGSKVTQSLPNVNASGFVMNVKQADGNMQVRVQSKGSNGFGEKIFILIHANETSFYSDFISLSNNGISIAIASNTLNEKPSKMDDITKTSY